MNHIRKDIKEQAISLKGHYKFTLRDIYTDEEQVFEYDNVVTSATWTMIANNFTDGAPDNTMLLNKAVLGTGTSTPTTADTQLQTEVYRNNLASKSNVANLAYATAYFNATETTGTYREAGIVVDGTASANTGVLVSRVAINITKTSSQTLTLEWTLTIS
jgi:hypothetical protein